MELALIALYQSLFLSSSIFLAADFAFHYFYTLNLYPPYIKVTRMFVLLDIEPLQPDLQNLPANAIHKLTFKVVYTIKDVPDSFTGIVFEDNAGELKLEHFNNPRGNRRKVITLKNKLVPGAFAQIKQALFASARGDNVTYPLQLETLVQRQSGKGGA